ncbi:MAG: pyruvate dehydrogenase complex dihydrolipoamide acetyltransferase [Rhodothermales bacterium]
MAIAVEMPKMSDTMEEGVLVAWMVEEGDTVSAGDVIAQVETDKATMDLEVYDDGVLLKKVVGDGDAVPIGALIAVLGKQGEDVSSILARYAQRGDGTSAAAVPETKKDTAMGPASAAGDGASVGADAVGRLKVSPLARRLAREHGIDLRALQGSGPEGRIVKRDVEGMLTGQEEAVPARIEVPVEAPIVSKAPARIESLGTGEEEGYESVRISQMRKTIARRLAQSKFGAPHFYLTVDIDMERAVAGRKHLNAVAESQGISKISFNDLITKACALALRRHPQVNASYLEDEGEIRRYHYVHVGVAVAIDEGLVTPVIRHADRKGLVQIAEETRALAARARDRRLQPDEMAGSTFTTSNLGMFGIEEFTAIINPPNACILAIGAIRDVPVVKDGQVVPGKRMKVTLSCDHRVVDGATGSRFLETVQQYLEEPLAMML